MTLPTGEKTRVMKKRLQEDGTSKFVTVKEERSAWSGSAPRNAAGKVTLKLQPPLKKGEKSRMAMKLLLEPRDSATFNPDRWIVGFWNTNFNERPFTFCFFPDGSCTWTYEYGVYKVNGDVADLKANRSRNLQRLALQDDGSARLSKRNPGAGENRPRSGVTYTRKPSGDSCVPARSWRGWNSGRTAPTRRQVRGDLLELAFNDSSSEFAHRIVPLQALGERLRVGHQEVDRERNAVGREAQRLLQVVPSGRQYQGTVVPSNRHDPELPRLTPGDDVSNRGIHGLEVRHQISGQLGVLLDPGIFDDLGQDSEESLADRSEGLGSSSLLLEHFLDFGLGQDPLTHE